MQEIPRLMDDYEFRKELERIREHLDAISTVMWNPFTTIMRRQCSVIQFGMQ